MKDINSVSSTIDSILKPFSPTSPEAFRKVQFLLKRGALVISVEAPRVRIACSGRTATIRANGKVKWDA